MNDIPPGIRNNNPGNLVKRDTIWLGEVSNNDDPRFERFTEPFYGIRAMAKVLLAYYRKHGLRTIRAIIERWAPASENNTEAYIEDVCGRTRLVADVEITPDEDTLVLLCKAMIHHENGQNPYDDVLIAAAVESALK